MATSIAAIALSACGSIRSASDPGAAATPAATKLPGTGKPLVIVGDKNYSEQFVLGELYAQALKAQGYAVQLNRDIGPTEVSTRALSSDQLSIYPEYVGTWNTDVAGVRQTFDSARDALRAARRYARAHGIRLLDPTPFSDTGAIAVTAGYGAATALRTIGDLQKVAPQLTLGAPPQFPQSSDGLPLLEKLYGFTPASFKPLAVGGQYRALDQGLVQAAEVNSTDGQLSSGRYRLLRDPLHAFGWGQVVPVVPIRVIEREGPAFARTVNRVSALLTAPVMRELNAAVDLQGEDPAAVARQFLQDRGLLAEPPP